MRLFKSNNGIFEPVHKRDFGIEKLERNLEDWLGSNPQLLGDDILLIGRQVRTEHGIIDLLALDPNGNAVVIELKRGRATRDVVGQLNSYLTIVNRWSDRDLERNANLIPYNKESSNLIKKFKEHFKCTTAPDFNAQQIGIVVAEDFESDFIPQIGGLRFACRVLQFSNFVTGTGDEYLLINPLHDPLSDLDQSDEDADESPAADVPTESKERFFKLLRNVHEMLRKDVCPEAAGWRLHESKRDVQGVFSRWQKNWEGVSLYFDHEAGKNYLHTNCIPKHNRTLSSLLKRDMAKITEALGKDIIWDPGSWESVAEWVSDDPKQVASRVRAYIEILQPYLDQALPQRGRGNTRSERSGEAYQKDLSQYRFEGNLFGKGRLVHAVIAEHIHRHPRANLESLERDFPPELQGSLGVVSRADEARKRSKTSGRPRHFLEEREVLTTDDGTQVAVCSQWGAGNINQFIDRAKELGYAIEKVGPAS